MKLNNSNFGILAIVLGLVMTVAGLGYADSPPRGYNGNLSQDHSFRYTVAGEPVRYGQRAERFELRDGECGRVDCGHPRFRAEIRMARGRTQARIGQDIWYGWSFYNENIRSFPGRNNIMNVVGQWKMGGDAAPIFKLVQIGRNEGNFRGCDGTICNRSSQQSWDVVVQLDDMKNAHGWGERQNWGLVCRLFSMEANRGRWVDIVVNTNFSTGSDGYLRIWINGQQRCDYRGPMVVNTSRSLYPGPNHRRGIFVSYTRRWERERPGQPYPTQIVFYDEFLVGRNRAEVDTRQRIASGLPPVH